MLASEDESTHPRHHTSLLYAVKRVELVVRAHLDELLKPSGITALQYTALTVLERHDGVSAAQLARDSFVTAQSMADMVRILEQRGLIHRERNPANRRELLLHLSDAGQRFLAEYADKVAALEGRMVSTLTRRQIEQFRSALTEAWHALK
jgi:DNA-binding MarR family transcriptional regulator